MPPRKGIVKSGNAGNSSKANKAPEPAPVPLGEKSLFPPGIKTPLNLLHERCQKNRWEKPSVETRQTANGWAFTVHLARMHKDKREAVTMKPHPDYLSPTALEARHWGATYALYRFCNRLQLNLLLPPGPRDYWNNLAAEHKKAPDHLQWQYNADPFAAHKEVKARQDVTAKAREDRQNPAASNSSRKPDQSGTPEVKMASSLRDLVEDAVKKGYSMYPEASDLIPREEELLAVANQLSILGFSTPQARLATEFFSRASPLATSLLRSSPLRDACIEFLILELPECDLPTRFMPEQNSSVPFVTSAHSGTQNIKLTWLESKAIKEAGWPVHVVKETLAKSLVHDWDTLLVSLGQKLVGVEYSASSIGDDTPFYIDQEEADAMGANVSESGFVMPLFSAPQLELHVSVSSKNNVPRPSFCPIALVSSSVPAYVRLHLTSRLLRQIIAGTLLEPGEGFCMASMRVLEDEWQNMEDHGRPNVSSVLQYIIPKIDILPSVQDLPDRMEHAESVPTSRKRIFSKQPKGTGGQDLLAKPEYQSIVTKRQTLPAFAVKQDFLQLLDHHRVVVVVGETGSGKTTQLPQFILDSLIEAKQGTSASIIITQPRRLAAVSVAARVSEERLNDGSVGYAIRGERRQTSQTKLLFCTTGIVLRRLSAGDSLSNVTHVVVDEVHERSVDGDFLLLQLKDLLDKHPTLKIVLMSATINHEIFMEYFNSAPLLSIPGSTYPVEDIYLEDIIQRIGYNKLETVRRTVIDFDLIVAIIQHLIQTKPKAGVLVFLPGVQDIRRCVQSIRNIVSPNEGEVYPLHANLAAEEQGKVFLRTSKWKVIVATNIAETSITIDDVCYVIDSGRMKEMRHVSETNITGLVEDWVSQAAVCQRRGRAGRTRPGTAFHLYTKEKYEEFAKFPVPEILRIPLESICLLAKVTREEEDVKLILGRAIDPPQLTAIDAALTILQDIGALDDTGGLTPLGRHIATLPLHPRLAKMLILATVFRCLSPILTVTGCFSASKSVFQNPIDRREEANLSRARFAQDGSDLLTDVRAYDECKSLRPGEQASFCEKNFISYSTIRDISTLRNEYFAIISDIGFVPSGVQPEDSALNANSRNSGLLKAIILGGLSPQVARVRPPDSKFVEVQGGTLQKDNKAQEYRFFDAFSRSGRLFLHPSSVLFKQTGWKSHFVVYIQKSQTSAEGKVFLRGVTEVPLYALLLFGGSVSANTLKGGLTVSTKEGKIHVGGWPRIAILVNQLKRLLDAQLQRCFDDGAVLTSGQSQNPVVHALTKLLAQDGMSE